jgi:hypothetical protein
MFEEIASRVHGSMAETVSFAVVVYEFGVAA